MTNTMTERKLRKFNQLRAEKLLNKLLAEHKLCMSVIFGTHSACRLSGIIAFCRTNNKKHADWLAWYNETKVIAEVRRVEIEKRISRVKRISENFNGPL